MSTSRRFNSAENAPASIRQAAPVAPFAAWLVDVEARLAHLEQAGAHPRRAVIDAPETEVLIDDAPNAADIGAAYRLLLDREADTEGLRTYLERAVAGTITRSQLVAEMLDSDERLMIEAARIAEVDLGEVRVVVDSTESEFGRTIAQDRVWEAHVVAQIKAHLAPGSVFVDIGANIGVMSFHAARAVGATGKVIAFEPNPDNVQRFLQGVQINGFDTITMFPVAVSDIAGILSIRGSSNTYVAEARLGQRLVSAVPADDMLVAEARIDLIKLDIEGHEPRALAGLARTMARHRPVILCEFNPRCLRTNGHVDPDAFATGLFAMGNRIEIIEHDGSLLPVETAKDLMAIWSERNLGHVARGDLADGLVHFDLLLHPAR